MQGTANTIILPAYNEASALGEVIRGVHAALAEVDGPSEILVVDDG
jgi:glycosyltransferase involved in cell wall biosynthesis